VILLRSSAKNCEVSTSNVDKSLRTTADGVWQNEATMNTQASSEPRILIVDDDTELCDMLGRFLETEGFHIDSVHDGQAGVDEILRGDYDVVVLDVMMPKLNGMEVLKTVRAKVQTRVLMLTARGEDIDRIVGLEIGADDYLTKPCNPRELAARLRAILRRPQRLAAASGEQRQSDKYRLDDLLLDTGSQTVYRGERPLPLTGAEYSVLELLVKNAGSVVGKDELTQFALGRRLSPYDRSIDTHIGHLRKKLGPAPDGSQRIKTVRGKGYLFINR
jgi:two-component system response regulator CpxR